MMDSRPSSKREEERARHPRVDRLLVKTDLRETVEFSKRWLQVRRQRENEGHATGDKGVWKGTSRVYLPRKRTTVTTGWH